MDNAPTPPPPGNWQADLNGLFDTIGREDQAFADNMGRQTAFYQRTALPALQAAAEALRQHGRTAETGQEPERVYLIVSKLTGEVEFQYAVVAEVRIEAVTPYIHCWFEENELAEALRQEHGRPEKPAAADQQDDDGDDDDDKDDDDDEAAGGGEEDSDEPARTKTIEVLGTWRAGRALDSVTQEEILHDFVRHYREALALARTQLHLDPAELPQ